MELPSFKRACKVVCQTREVGNLLIFDPSVDCLSNLSGCVVTRPNDTNFAPKRTNQEKQLFIKSMLRKYADGQSFTSSTHNDKKLTMEDGWCSALHEFIEEETETLLRLKLKLYVDLDDTYDLPKIPKINSCAEKMRDYACKLFLLKTYWHLSLHEKIFGECYFDEDPHEDDHILSFRDIINEDVGNPPLPNLTDSVELAEWANHTMRRGKPPPDAHIPLHASLVPFLDVLCELVKKSF